MRILACLFGVVVMLCTASAYAQVSIAVLDVGYILTQSKAAKSITKQREDLQSSFLAEISKKEQKLREQEKSLLAEREKISAEEFLKKKQDYERSLLETGRSVKDRKQALEKASVKASQTLRDKLTDIAQGIAKEKEYDLVLTKQNVVVGSAALDITEVVLEKLNKDLPDVKLEMAAE